MFELLKNILNHYIFKKYSLTFNDPKDILPIILLIPTFIGGIWQILELGYIGTPYIRFFSVAQILPDGLVIIFIIFSLSLYISNTAAIYEKKSFVHHTKYKMRWLLIFLIGNLALIIIGIIGFIKFHKTNEILMNVIIQFTLLYFLIRAIIYICELLITIRLKIKNIEPKILDDIFNDFIKQDYTKNYTRILTLIFLTLFIITLYFSSQLIRKFAYYPNNFENITKLENELIKNFRLCEPPKLEYFNKDYLFYKFKIDDKERVYVIESKNLFLSPLEPIIKEKKENED